jgi:hypothetical protein
MIYTSNFITVVQEFFVKRIKWRCNRFAEDDFFIIITNRNISVISLYIRKGIVEFNKHGIIFYRDNNDIYFNILGHYLSANNASPYYF